MQRSSLVLGSLGLCATAYAYWLDVVDSVVTIGVTAAIAALALCVIGGSFAKARVSTATHIGVPIVLLSLLAAVLGLRLAGIHLLPIDPAPEPRYAIFELCLIAFAVSGLLKGWFLARWLAIALALGGVGSSVLNLMAYPSTRAPLTWALAMTLAGALLMVGSLMSSDVRERFSRRASSIWVSREPIMRWMRAAIVSILAASPMLLVYAWRQPVAPGTKTTAVVLAFALLVAVGLTARRKVVGALLLAVGGALLVAQAIATVYLAYDVSSEAGWISLYYLAFWLPAGLIAIGCGVAVARPTLRLLKN